MRAEFCRHESRASLACCVASIAITMYTDYSNCFIAERARADSSDDKLCMSAVARFPGVEVEDKGRGVARTRQEYIFIHSTGAYFFA